MRRIVGALTGLCLLAGAALTGWEADGGPPGVAPGRAVPPERTLPAPRPVDGAALVKQILERPLFAPTRRPYVTAHLVQAPEPTPLPPLPEPAGALIGTAIGPNQRLALFRRSDGGEMVSLGIGDALDRWVVTEIDLGSVTLQADTGESRVVAIERSLGVAPPIKLHLPAFHNEV